MSATRSVPAASHPRVVKVSCHQRLMASALSRGMATWSQTAMLWKPLRSAARAIAIRSAGVVSASHGPASRVVWVWIGSWVPKASVPGGISNMASKPNDPSGPSCRADRPPPPLWLTWSLVDRLT